LPVVATVERMWQCGDGTHAATTHHLLALSPACSPVLARSAPLDPFDAILQLLIPTTMMMLILFFVSFEVSPLARCPCAPAANTCSWRVSCHLAATTADATCLQGVCNVFAEVTRFGDRDFYGPWWNARSFAEFSRTWNR